MGKQLLKQPPPPSEYKDSKSEESIESDDKGKKEHSEPVEGKAEDM